MLPYTIQYLDDYMQNYLEEPLAKTRYAGFISDDKIFTFIDMKYHKVLKTEKEQSMNIYACYVRTTDKKNQLKSVDMDAYSSYMWAVEKYPKQNGTCSGNIHKIAENGGEGSWAANAYATRFRLFVQLCIHYNKGEHQCHDLETVLGLPWQEE